MNDLSLTVVESHCNLLSANMGVLERFFHWPRDCYHNLDDVEKCSDECYGQADIEPFSNEKGASG